MFDYNKCLTMTWSEILDSDIVLKCNSVRRIVEIDMNDSVAVIYYNMHFDTPMILLRHWDGIGLNVEAPDVPGFHKEITEDTECTVPCTEVVYVLEELRKALDS